MAIQYFNLPWFNETMSELGDRQISLSKTKYEKPRYRNGKLLNNENKRSGTKGDMYTKQILDLILQKGTLDINPRPVYKDFYEDAKYIKSKRLIITKENDEIYLSDNDKVIEKENGIEVWVPAHTISVNQGVECTYDLSNGESPLITLRPIATKASIAEILWIYQQASNDLVKFDELLGKRTWEKDKKINNWWEEWALRDKDGNYILNDEGHPTIGACYGETVKRRNYMKNLIKSLKENPFGRRQIIDLWQVDDFSEAHGLKPCAYNTTWNVRYERDGEYYLDLTLSQRSSDFGTAGCINQMQYVALLHMIAKEVGLKPGRFTWKPVNIQIYDRHIPQAIEMLDRAPVNCEPKIILPDEKGFYDLVPDDIQVVDYPKQLIKEKNPQLKFELGI